MTAEANKAVVRRTFEEVWNSGQLDVADEVYAPGHSNHDPVFPSIVPGPDGITPIVSMYRAGFPDLQFTVEDMVAEGDRVVTRWSASGTHTGELRGIAPYVRGIPPTNKRVTVTGITISHIANGQIVESWSSWDTLGMMQQLGLIPTAG